jgi:tetratricopeptide (TPR) repeat protein
MLVQRGFHGATLLDASKKLSTGQPPPRDNCVKRSAVAKTFCFWHFARMKFFLGMAVVLAGLTLNLRAQQQADENYVGIYGLIQQASNLADTGEPAEALAAFKDAQTQLHLFQKKFPGWNPNIVNFRLNSLAEKISTLKPQVPATLPPTKKIEIAATPANVTDASQEPNADIDNLRSQLQSALTANEQLQAKLKEALAVQPAAADPRELEQARETIRDLMKQNDLLKAGESTAPATNIQTLIVTNFATLYVTNTPGVVTNLVEVYVTNSTTTVVTNEIRTVVVDTNELEMLRLNLAAAEKNFNDEHARAEQLVLENSQLKTSGNPATNLDSILADLRAENARLKKQIADLPTVTAANQPVGTELATLKSDLEIAKLEKLALQQKLQQVLAVTNTTANNTAELEARIRDLTQERNSLMEKLDRANHQKPSGKTPEAAAQISSLTDEVSILRARLAVTEAAPIPYSTEELALFKITVPPVASPQAEKKSISELPAGTAELVASAQQHFVHQEFTAAESDYLKILERDQNNGIALANLATIELLENKLDVAEKNITTALKQSPDDAYNLSTLGYLKFREEKYDDALNALSHAAQIDPNNPEIQNYLGVTLSHKGQRKAAETALRKAIQLNPNYAPAHNNLAVIYLDQTPPLAELARWHYQKALDAGQPHNADLEKMLADKGAPVSP